MILNNHCMHKLRDVPNGSIQVICCFCGLKSWWRGDASKEHGPHLPYVMATFGTPMAAPVVLFHAPTCAHRQAVEPEQP